MATTKKLMGTTAAGGAEALAIEDCFSCFLYTGNGSTQTITNGIDLAGEGGLVWIKDRSAAFNHAAHDTEQGATKYLTPNSTDIAITTSGFSFNSDGFTVGSLANDNRSGDNYASWTWRKAPRWFDCVTYTGNGSSSRSIAHNLGVEPGCVIFKQTSGTSNWIIYHRSLGVASKLSFDADAAGGGSGYFVSASDTDFVIGNDTWINSNGQSYVAYFFAHDPLGPSGDGSDGLIACGSYTGNGTDGLQIDLGWEPQWLLFKNASITENWRMFDTMRGIATPYPDPYLDANLSNAETSFATTNYVNVEPTGFSVGSNPSVNGNGNTIIYIAIRRGPMRQPTSGTEVFYVDKSGATEGQGVQKTTGFPVDLQILKILSGGQGFVYDRLRGVSTNTTDSGQLLYTSSTDAETSLSGTRYWDNEGYQISGALGNNEWAYWNFSRAPGFFDAVAYTGDGVAGRTVSHNLGVAPEMMIVKKRDGVDSWRVYHSGLNGGTTPENYFVNLNNANTEAANSAFWNNTAPASTEFTVGTNVNGSGANYIAYLFATLPGVSKVGSYTGNGGTGDINVDCGFTSGARFVLIKDATSANDWYVWDTARGIVAGNDPYLRLNSTGAETTDSDWVDPYSAGFTVTTGLLANLRINVSGNTYIFLAIA